MKKIIRNIIFLAGIIFLINYALHAFLLPFSWGDKDLHSKLTYYKANKDDYNALFIGGSLVYRHIDPHTTDSVLNANNIEFNSFNAGGDGIAFLKQLRILEDVIKDPSPELDYAFLSLSSTSRFMFRNLHTKRFTTWQRPKDLIRAIRLTMELPISIKLRLKFCWYYFISVAENAYNIGLLNDAIEYLNYPEKAYNAKSLGLENNGFLPYDLQEKIEYEKGSWEYNMQQDMIMSHLVYNEKIERRDSLTAQIKNDFETYNPDKVLNSMLSQYEKMIERCKAKGIQLIIIMSPKTRESYKFLIPVFDKLPEAHKIDMADPRKYPAFYDPEYCYNFHHLNNKGAQIFSKALAEEIAALKNKTAGQASLFHHHKNEID